MLKKAVAHAMRHSTALQASSAYDKERAERTWAAAVQAGGRVRRVLRVRRGRRAGGRAPHCAGISLHRGYTVVGAVRGAAGATGPSVGAGGDQVGGQGTRPRARCVMGW